MMVVIHKLIENIQCFKQRNVFFHGLLSLGILSQQDVSSFSF